MYSDVVEQVEPFAVASGTDGYVYAVRPLVWSLEMVDKYYERFKPYKILSDDMPQGREGFEAFVLTSGALWFEIVNVDLDQAVGILYVADFVQSQTNGRFLSASFHMSLWDAKVSHRMPVLREFVRKIFKVFKLHRLEMEIPLFAGGAIRLAKISGFTDEGVRRKARRYNNTWWGVLHLSMLENEVP